MGRGNIFRLARAEGLANNWRAGWLGLVNMDNFWRIIQIAFFVKALITIQGFSHASNFLALSYSCYFEKNMYCLIVVVI
jgi:hypothetical protein